MPDFLTVTIQLPSDKEGRKKITSAFKSNESFYGGRITGLSLEDEISLNEKLIEVCEREGRDDLVSDARTAVAELHSTITLE